METNQPYCYLAMDQVERFLESNDFKAYKEYFEEEGYDSMPQLLPVMLQK